jgi:hypothetical protein
VNFKTKQRRSQCESMVVESLEGHMYSLTGLQLQILWCGFCSQLCKADGGVHVGGCSEKWKEQLQGMGAKV